MAVNSITLNDTFEGWINTTNDIGSDIGDIITLATPIKTSVVEALNGLDSDIGTRTSLTTTITTSLVGAINSLDSDKISYDSAVADFFKTDTAFTKTSGDITFNDNVQANFGTGSDLQIYHDGSHSYIVDSGTGNLKILSSQIDLMGGADGAETMATFVDDGAVTLYNNNTIRFTTTDSGGTVSGNIRATGTTRATTATLSAATPLTLTSGTSNWTVSISSNSLVFAYGGTNLMELDSAGNMTVIGNITAYGTI